VALNLGIHSKRVPYLGNCQKERKLLLFTHRKSHDTGFRLVPKSVTLNDLERRAGLCFAYNCADFAEFRIFGPLRHTG